LDSRYPEQFNQNYISVVSQPPGEIGLVDAKTLSNRSTNTTANPSKLTYSELEVV
jgi:hypothetical protein